MYSCHEESFCSPFSLLTFAFVHNWCSICWHLQPKWVSHWPLETQALSNCIIWQLCHSLYTEVGIANSKKFSAYLFINLQAKKKKLHLFLNCSTVLPIFLCESFLHGRGEGTIPCNYLPIMFFERYFFKQITHKPMRHQCFSSCNWRLQYHELKLLLVQCQQ